jgi:hypothetical protein
MPAKNDKITKDPSGAGRKGGRMHGGEQLRTKIKNVVTNWDQVEGLVEKNIIEFLSSKNKKTRMWATRYLSEFAKSKKREISGRVGLTITNFIEDDL